MNGLFMIDATGNKIEIGEPVDFGEIITTAQLDDKEITELRELLEPTQLEIEKLKIAAESLSDCFREMGATLKPIIDKVAASFAIFFDPKNYQVAFYTKRQRQRDAKRLNRERRLEKVKQRWAEKVGYNRRKSYIAEIRREDAVGIVPGLYLKAPEEGDNK